MDYFGDHLVVADVVRQQGARVKVGLGGNGIPAGIVGVWACERRGLYCQAASRTHVIDDQPDPKESAAARRNRFTRLAMFEEGEDAA
jgi:hypothetical protein